MERKKLPTSGIPQNNASFNNHRVFWFFLSLMCLVYLVCIHLPLLEAWRHVLWLSLLLTQMVLVLIVKMLILSLKIYKFSNLILRARQKKKIRLINVGAEKQTNKQKKRPFDTWLDFMKGFIPKSNWDWGWDAMWPLKRGFVRWRPRVGENLSWITPGPVPMPLPANNYTGKMMKTWQIQSRCNWWIQQVLY